MVMGRACVCAFKIPTPTNDGRFRRVGEEEEFTAEDAENAE
jgi:hypothetical protein